MKRNLRIFIYSSLFVHLAGGTALFLYYFSPSAPRSVHRETTNDKTESPPQTTEQVLKSPEKLFETEDRSPNTPMKTASQTEDLITIGPNRENLTVSNTSKPRSVKPAENLPHENGSVSLSSDPEEKTASPEKKRPRKTTQGRPKPALAKISSSQATGEKAAQKSAPSQKPPKSKKTTQITPKSTATIKPTQTTGKTPPTQDNKKTAQTTPKSTTTVKPTQTTGKTPPTQDNVKTAQTTPKSTATTKSTQTTGKTPPTQDNKKTAQTTKKTSPVSNSPLENPPDLSSVNFKDFQDLKQKRGNPELTYPQEARKKKIQGTVSIIYFVSPEGLVDKIQLAKSSGNSLLDNQTLRAVARYEFFPGQEGWVRHTVAFRLNGEEEQILKLRGPTE